MTAFPRRLVGAICLLAAWLAACGDPPVVDAAGEVRVSPAALGFPPTWIGHPEERAVVVENRGRSPIRVELGTAPPFSVPSAEVLVAGGERRSIPVRFAPQEEGRVSGALHLSTGDVVRLEGEGRQPPSCPPSDTCRQVFFDPAAGGCVEERAPEGSLCGDACFGGSCIEGICVGETLSCDDGNACTLDACDPASGCLHYDDTASCPGSDDPCRSPICDGEVGCAFAEAPDGTSCGPADCTTSHVCLAGSCTRVETPEGGACGTESPCQEAGVCVAGACIQDPPVPLVPTWRHLASPGAALHFDGTVDPQGHVYWAECTQVSCDLVSVTIRGFARFRRTAFVEDVGRLPTGSLSLAGDLLVSTFAPNRLETYRTGDGAPVWSRDLLAAVRESGAMAPPPPRGEPRTPPAPEWVEEAAPPVVARDVILVALSGFRRQGDRAVPVGGWVVAVARETGAVRWRWAAEGAIEGFVGDEAGSVTFALRRHGAPVSEPGELVSLGTTGVERWRVRSAWQAPLATLGGLLLQATGELRTTAEGGLHTSLPLLVPTFPRRSPLLGGRSLYAFGVPLEPCDSGLCPTWVNHLFRVDLDTGEERWRQQLPSSTISEPVLTRGWSVVFAQPVPGTGGRASWLVELAPEGHTVFSCALPAGGRYDGAAVLHMGQWITVDGADRAVVAFDLQDREAPLAGWVMRRGGPAQTGRPR